MALKTIISISIGAMLLMGSVAAQADAYRPGEFLLLDLNQAALSPKPLGPPTQFEPVAIEAKTDIVKTGVLKTGAAKTGVAKSVPAARLARAVVKPRVAAHRPLARVRTNPLDANAADTRVQVWPCRSGGICNWQR